LLGELVRIGSDERATRKVFWRWKDSPRQSLSSSIFYADDGGKLRNGAGESSKTMFEFGLRFVGLGYGGS
jgi:hypothetical protein